MFQPQVIIKYLKLSLQAPSHPLQCPIVIKVDVIVNLWMMIQLAIDNIFNGIDVNSATQTYVLAEKFGVTHFRDFQKKAVEASLEGKDILIIQPTGKGKSLCYQFPAVYTEKTTLVITPTISLMQYQTCELNSKGIEAIFLGSAQSDPLAETKAFSVDNPAPIIYVSPEWLFGKQCHIDSVSALYQAKMLGLIAIDEAHLMYEWVSFREHYRNCAELHSLFSGVPIMALTATATPSIASKLKSFLRNPLVLTDTMNRPNIFLATHQCSFKKAGGPSQLFGLDHRDFNSFADEVSSLIGNECSIVYTDFANHVAPIVIALRDRGVQAIGYYGKMNERDKLDAYKKWKNNEYAVIVVTRAFGLGINKPDVRYVIRNGLPPSISAWVQEFGRAGHDGKSSEAHIFYSDDDIHHVGFWNGNLARTNRSEHFSDVSDDFSNALTFTYAHLAGQCRRKLFEEDECNATANSKCCDVCESEVIGITDKRNELAILISAIDELGNCGEVRVTEWIRGG